LHGDWRTKTLSAAKKSGFIRSRKMERQRLHIIYSGRVQGVGFRFTVKQTARGFEASGTVRNLPDGRVEFIAEGERAELAAFAQAIRESGVGSFIKSETVAWQPASGGLRGFEIVG
jgi:acylphosphatase